MICVNIKIIGFRDSMKSGLNLNKICVDEKNNVLDILKHVEESSKIVLEPDEIMIICDDKQLYVNDKIPLDCKELLIFPLALGGCTT